MAFVFSVPAAPPKFPELEKKETKDLLAKWDLLNTLFLCRLSFDKHFRGPTDVEEFMRDFFASPVVQSAVSIVASCRRSDNMFSPLSAARLSPERKIAFHTIPATWTTTTPFDKFAKSQNSLGPGIVRESGHIVKCLDMYLDNNVVAGDELRKYLLAPEESDYYGLFSQDQEEQECLFKLLRLCAVGGGLSQFEDTLEPYVSVARGLYRDLVSVHKSPHTQRPEVSSVVVQVTDSEFFPVETGPSNLFLVSIDSTRRLVTVIYHAFLPVF